MQTLTDDSTYNLASNPIYPDAPYVGGSKAIKAIFHTCILTNTEK